MGIIADINKAARQKTIANGNLTNSCNMAKFSERTIITNDNLWLKGWSDFDIKCGSQG